MDRSQAAARLEVETTRADEKFITAIERLPEHLDPAIAEFCKQEVEREIFQSEASRRAALGGW